VGALTRGLEEANSDCLAFPQKQSIGKSAVVSLFRELRTNDPCSTAFPLRGLKEAIIFGRALLERIDRKKDDASLPRAFHCDRDGRSLLKSASFFSDTV
jgi:hypothetical protein